MKAAHLSLKAGVIQMTSTDCVEDNLSQASKLIKQASLAGCQMVVLPENFAAFGYSSLSEISENELNFGPILQFLSQSAKAYDMWIVGGTAPFNKGVNGNVPLTNKVFAGCSVWSPKGECITRYDKRHLFDVQVADGVGRYCESDTFMAGSRINAAETPWGRVGLSVCYDLRFPEHYRILSDLGCSILVVPSAFTFQTGEAHWEVLLRARAIENQCYVLAANQSGDHGNGRNTWGHSSIIDPWGAIIAQCQTQGCGLITADLDFCYLNQIRSQMPVLKHRL